MIKKLPLFLQFTYESERKDSSERLFKNLEWCIQENNIKAFGIFPLLVKHFHMVHRLTAEEKQKIFSLILYFLTQPYIYKTQHIFSQIELMHKVLPMLKSFSGSVNKQCEIDWIQIDKIYQELIVNDIHNSFLQGQFKQIQLRYIDKYIFSIIRFFTILKPLVSPTKYAEIFHNYVSGTNFYLMRLLRVVRNEPTSTYIGAFREMMELKEAPSCSRHVLQQLMPQLLNQKPDLPFDDYIDKIMHDIYFDFINQMPHKDKSQIQQAAAAMRRAESMPPSLYIATVIVNLIAPLSKFPGRIVVWDTIGRMFSVIRDLLHPNNNNDNKFAMLFLQQFVRAFTIRWTKQHKKQVQLNNEEEQELKEHFSLKDYSGQESQDEDDGQEESDDEDEQDVVDYTEYWIDEDGEQRFIGLMKPILKYLVYLKDSQKSSIRNIFSHITRFKAQEFMPEIMENIVAALQRDDMKPHTIISVIENVLPSLLDRQNYPQGITHIPFILRQTINFINDHGEIVWRLYDKFFQFIPVYDSKDLKHEYPGKDLATEMNYGDVQVDEITQEISDLAMEAFRKYVSTLEFVDAKYSGFTRLELIIFSPRNKFYNFVAQCSHSNYQEVVQIVGDYLDGNILTKLNESLVHIVQAIMHKDSKCLDLYLNIIVGKSLKQVKEHYEFDISNTQTQLNYLQLLAEMIQFAGSVNKQYYGQIKQIINLALNHDETKIQTAGIDIMCALFMGLVSIHIKDFNYRNNGKYDLHWANSEYTEKYTFDWVDNTDNEFLGTLINDFLHPAIKYINTISTDQQQDQLSEYIGNNFENIILQLNEPKCSSNMLQVDVKTRRQIGKNLEIISGAFQVLNYRIKQPYTQQTSPMLINMQKQLTLPPLDGIYTTILTLIKDFFKVYVNMGISSDPRISVAYLDLQKSFLGESASSGKISRLRKWVSMKVYSQRLRQRKLACRYQAILLTTSFLNYRVTEVYDSEDSPDYQQPLLYIWVALTFEQNESNANRYKILFNWYLPQLRNIQPFQVFTKITHSSVLKILRGQLFNQQAIEALQEAHILKHSLFQKNYLNGLARYYQATLKLLGNDLIDIYSDLESVYQNVIDKTFKGQFNQIMINTQSEIHTIITQSNTAQYDVPSTVIQFKDQKLQDYVKSVCDGRKMPSIEDVAIQQKCQGVVDKFLTIPPEQTRQCIVHGVALCFLSHHTLPQFRPDVIILAAQLCKNSEFPIRSFGRTLLFRLRNIGIQKHTKHINELTQVGDFKLMKKTWEEYMQSRTVMPQHVDKLKQSDGVRLGVLFEYNTCRFKDFNHQALKDDMKPLLTILTPEFNVDLLRMFALDLTISEMQSTEIKDYSNIYNDVSNYLGSKINSSVQKEKQPNLPYSLAFKLLKFLLQVTDFQFFRDTKTEISFAGIDDRDVQQFQRVYFSALISAVHSSWPVDEQVKVEVLLFCRDYLDACVERQSKELFSILYYHLYYVFYNVDVRRMQTFLDLVVQGCVENKDNHFKLIRWLQIMFYCVEQKKFQAHNHLHQLFEQVELQFHNSKIVQIQLFLIMLLNYKMPHSVGILNNLGLLEQAGQQEGMEKRDMFYLENPRIFDQMLSKVVIVFAQNDYTIRRVIVDAFMVLLSSMHGQVIHPRFIDKLQIAIIQLLTFSEEQVQNEQELQQIGQIIQLITSIKINQQQAVNIVNQVICMLPLSASKAKQRQLIFLKMISKSYVFINQIELIDKISPYLNDDSKQVSDLSLELITQLLQSLTQAELDKYLQLCITKTNVKESEVIAKILLMAIVMAHPRYNYVWSNQVLKLIFERCPSLVQKQKNFAADYLKLYKNNVVVESETHQIDIDIIEKMKEQIRKLSQVCDQISKKIRYIQKDGKLTMRICSQYSEVYTEIVLAVQQSMSMDAGELFEQIFDGMKSIVEVAAESLRVRAASPSPQPINMQVPKFVNSLQLGSVPLLDDYGQVGTIKSCAELPWNDYRASGKHQVARQLKTYAEKATSTLDDFVGNCEQALNQQELREQQVRNLQEHTEVTIALLNEALQNRTKNDTNVQSDPLELDRLVSEMSSKRFSLDQIIKETDLEKLKMSAQNFDHIQQNIREHIKDVQKATADTIFKYCHTKHTEKARQAQILADMKNKVKSRVIRNEDCRCAIYVNEIFDLKSRNDQQYNDNQKLQQAISDRDRQLREKEIQFKMMENLYVSSDTDKIEFRKKMELLQKEAKRQSAANDRNTSDNFLNVGDTFIDQGKQQINSVRKQSSDKYQRQPSSQGIILTNSVINDPTQVAQKKVQIMERLVTLVNVLDVTNQQKRLQQMQQIMANKRDTQVTELVELIKEIEEVDLLLPDVKIRIQSMYEDDNTFHSKSPFKLLDQSRNTEFFKFNKSTIELGDERQSLKLAIPQEADKSLSLHVPTQAQHYRRASVQSTSNQKKLVNPKFKQTEPSEQQQMKVSKHNTNNNNNNNSKQANMRRQSSLTIRKGDSFKGSRQSNGDPIYGYDQQQTDRFNSTRDPTTDRGVDYTLNSNGFKSQSSSQPNTAMQSPSRQNPIINRNYLANVPSEHEMSEMQSQLRGKSPKQEEQLQKISSSFRQMRNNAEYIQQDDFGNQKFRTQNTSPKNSQSQIKIQQDLIEEKIFFDPMLNEVTEQQEQQIIQQALSGKAGCEVGIDINEQALSAMYSKLDSNPQLQQLIRSYKGTPINSPVGYMEFKQFVKQMQTTHKRCGKDCIHLMRFFLRLGFVTTKYLSRKKVYKLAKPTIYPGFPRLQ